MIVLGYVDPGLGLLAWQLVVSFVLGCIFYVNRTRLKVGRFMQRVFWRRAQHEESPSEVQRDRSHHDRP